MRHFTQSRSRPRSTEEPDEPDPTGAVARRPEPANPAPDMTTPLITDEDGDLRQPLPSREDPSGTAGPVLPVFGDITAPLGEQEDARWRWLLEAMGFERQDQDAPVGFEDFDWSPIFPPDREHAARLLEPVVARSGDVQEEIDNFHASMT